MVLSQSSGLLIAPKSIPMDITFDLTLKAGQLVTFFLSGLEAIVRRNEPWRIWETNLLMMRKEIMAVEQAVPGMNLACKFRLLYPFRQENPWWIVTHRNRCLNLACFQNELFQERFKPDLQLKPWWHLSALRTRFFVFLLHCLFKILSFPSFFPRSWPTRIVLPLNDEHRQNEKSSLAPRFHDIRPSLLLFLHRLRGIFIHDKVGLNSVSTN